MADYAALIRPTHGRSARRRLRKRTMKARPMPPDDDAPVLIVGAGPVGLTLAIDLAWRGIKVMVAETRPRAQPPEPKCNHVAARTIEIFPRLRIAEKQRAPGLPPA